MKVFYSYCHADEEHRVTLETFLTTLRNEGVISEWHDRKINPGEVWNQEIKNNLDMADIVLLLVSQHYIASTSCNDEKKHALKHQNSKTIIPIILSPSTWADTECKNIQSLPKDGKAITTWSNQAEAWLDVYEGIKRVVNKRKQVIHNPTFITSIEEIPFVSANKEKIQLSDVFVWPEFRLNLIKGGEEVIDGKVEIFIDEKKRYSLVRTIELGGKSSLARKVFLESKNHGYLSLILDGSAIFKRLDYEVIVKDAFAKQYNGEYTEYQKYPRRLMIVDDYHHDIRPNFVEWAKTTFTNLLFLLQEDEYITYYRDDDNFADFNLYSVRHLDRFKTYELVKKWKKLDPLLEAETEAFERSVDLLEDKVQTIINVNQIVPSYPFYIMNVLQAFEGFVTKDYQITTYGHCYASLITSQLIKKGIRPEDIGDCFNFLTFLAFEFYRLIKNERVTVSHEEYEAIKKTYKEKFLIKDNVISRIENPTYPIIRKNEHIKFEYPYIYYFFIGKHLAETVDVDVIKELCLSIHLKQSSNILIFTIHHSPNTTLLDEIQLHCMVTFDNQNPASLTTDETAFMSSLMDKLPRQIFADGSVEENREIERKRKDSIVVESNKDEEPYNINDEQVEIYRSLKIIEVLGQIIKNRAGSFNKEKIKELMLEVEKLGFRLLAKLLDSLKSSEFEHWLDARIAVVAREKAERKKFLDEQSRKYIVRINIQMIGILIIHTIIAKLFYSISTEKVLEVQEEVAKENPFPSYDVLTLLFKLNYKGIKYEDINYYRKKFEESKNRWASRTLEMVVQRYMRTHSVEYNVKQKISSLLGIPYNPNKPER